MAHGRRFHRHRRRQRSNGWAILLLAIGAAGVVIAHEIEALTAAQQHYLEAFVAGALALACYLAWRASRGRSLRRRRYNQALLDFHWHPGISPTEFERCCADYLNLRGWRASTTRATGDQGVDVIARKAGHTLVIQCKLYSKPVGNKAVQEAIAARVYRHASNAAVVSNRGYTRAAHELAEQAGVALLHFTELSRLDQIIGI